MIVTDQEPGRVNVAVFGEFSLADYKEFEEAVNYKVKFEGPVDLLVDLGKSGKRVVRLKSGDPTRSIILPTFFCILRRARLYHRRKGIPTNGGFAVKRGAE